MSGRGFRQRGCSLSALLLLTASPVVAAVAQDVSLDACACLRLSIAEPSGVEAPEPRTFEANGETEAIVTMYERRAPEQSRPELVVLGVVALFGASAHAGRLRLAVRADVSS